MDRSQENPISNELLSAYIDGVVTSEERARVEAAVAANPALAWELESLRRTVDLVRALPPVPLPRSFALREEQVADVLAERRARRATALAEERPARPPVRPVSAPGFWQQLLSFFNSGNLMLRNAAAVAALLLVVITFSTAGVEETIPAPMAASLEMAPVGAPAEKVQQAGEGESAPQAEAVAEAAPAVATVAPSVAPSEGEPAAAAAEAPAALALPAAADAPPQPAGDAPVAMGGESMAASAAQRSGPARPENENPPIFQAVPADLGPTGDGVIAASRAEAVPGQVTAQDAPAQRQTPALQAYAATAEGIAAEESSAADSSVAESAAEENTAEESAAEESAAEEAVPEQASAPEPAQVAPAAQVAPVAQEPAVQEAVVQQAEPQPASVPAPWPGWQLVQFALGGLVVLLAGLWLFTTRA